MCCQKKPFSELRLHQADGSKLAAGCQDGTLIVWDESGVKSFEVQKYSAHIGRIAWNRSQGSHHLLLTKSSNMVTYSFLWISVFKVFIWLQTVTIWDSLNKRALQTFQCHAEWIETAVWVSSTSLASCSFGGVINICKMNLTHPIRTFRHQVIPSNRTTWQDYPFVCNFRIGYAASAGLNENKCWQVVPAMEQ